MNLFRHVFSRFRFFDTCRCYGWQRLWFGFPLIPAFSDVAVKSCSQKFGLSFLKVWIPTIKISIPISFFIFECD